MAYKSIDMHWGVDGIEVGKIQANEEICRPGGSFICPNIRSTDITCVGTSIGNIASLKGVEVEEEEFRNLTNQLMELIKSKE